jgi:hypothetical protein
LKHLWTDSFGDVIEDIEAVPPVASAWRGVVCGGEAMVRTVEAEGFLPVVLFLERKKEKGRERRGREGKQRCCGPEIKRGERGGWCGMGTVTSTTSAHSHLVRRRKEATWSSSEAVRDGGLG